MSFAHLEGAVGLLATLLAFLLVQRWLHRELQWLFLLLTWRPNLALSLFSLLLFPGTLLHELSHVVAAWLMRVPVRRFSLVPRLMPNGQLQLGFIETPKVDFLRDAFIGAAPFFMGAPLVAFLGLRCLGFERLLPLLSSADWQALWPTLIQLTGQSDFWLWFYLTFAVSSTMIPSAADRRAWLAVGLVLGGLIGVGLLADGGRWLTSVILPGLNNAFLALALVFGIAFLIHFTLTLPVWFLRYLLARLRGVA